MDIAYNWINKIQDTHTQKKKLKNVPRKRYFFFLVLFVSRLNFSANMGSSSSVPVPSRKPVPVGKTRLCIAGYKISHHTGRARTIIGLIAKKYAADYESWMYFASGSDFEAFLKVTFDPVPFPDHLKGPMAVPPSAGQRRTMRLLRMESKLSHLAGEAICVRGCCRGSPGMRS